MKLNLPTKRAAITVAAVSWSPAWSPAASGPPWKSIQPRAPQAAVAADDGIDLDKLRRRELPAPQERPVRAHGIPSSAATGSGVNAPAQPAAPPLPFQYVGKWSRGDKTEVLVISGEELIAIDPGQKLGDYRVDQIGESSINFTYLPLKMKQSLELPAAEANEAMKGFTLIELLIVVAIVALLASAAAPLAELGCQRGKEQDLRYALREIREAIDAYKRAGDEGKIERKADSSGLSAIPRDAGRGRGRKVNPEKDKIYFLRRIPQDPLTGEDWGLRSYASPADDPRAGNDVYDVYSRSDEVGLNKVPVQGVVI